ncbi:MAG: fluoride efflux transporter CrcB [Candidatus Limnocylindrales bacterium]
MTYLAISIGAVLGANFRYLLGGWISDRWGTSFPVGTFVINVTGSFVIGIVLTLVTERLAAPSWVRPMIAIGFLGSYTTFSTFSYETLALARDGAWVMAGLNVLLSVAASLVGVYLGTSLARAI